MIHERIKMYHSKIMIHRIENRRVARIDNMKLLIASLAYDAKQQAVVDNPTQRLIQLAKFSSLGESN